ncbi:MAG TPA: hypothetical protein PKA60_01215 [Candidatus Paceibacterota bacterium]|nr:hypothetical protein [Candidatus Paceibacterota bacterium]
MKTSGEELWGLHTGLSPTGLTQLVDLSDVSSETREIERKYRFPSDQEKVDVAVSELFAKVGNFVTRKKHKILNLVTFVGIDQYYIYKVGDREFQFRYRSGANRPPQVTVKYQLTAGSNLARGEINIGVGNTDPSKVRTFMSVLAAMLTTTPIVFAVQQSGNIWIIEDKISNGKVEVVVYRTKRFAPTPYEGVFVEIEPLEFEDVESAINVIKHYESALNLGAMVCEQSIAEMFRPGAESQVKD